MTPTTTSAATASASRTRSRSALDILTLTGLFGVIVDSAVSQLVSRHVIPPLIVFSTIYLVAALAALSGWRWAMLIPLIAAPLGIIGELSTGFPQYALVHPTEHIPFTNLTIEYGLLVMVIGASAVKFLQVRRHETPQMPRWMTPALTALGGLVLGALLVGFTAQVATADTVVSNTSHMVTVHLTSASFAPNIVALHAGDSLNLVDDGPVPHVITNGTWSAANHQEPGIEPGAPTVNNLQLNANSAPVGPFTTPGTYHIYCTLHPGMALTIIVAGS